MTRFYLVLFLLLLSGCRNIQQSREFWFQQSQNVGETMSETEKIVKSIARIVARKKIESEFILDLAIIQELKKSGESTILIERVKKELDTLNNAATI